jgi:tetratricopeptide (TPR) repeat protein
MAYGLSDLAHRSTRTRKQAEAGIEYRKALRLYQKLVDDNPAVTGFHSNLAFGHDNLGFFLKEGAGTTAEAEGEYRKSLALCQKLVAENPAVPEFQSALAATTHNLADVLESLRRTAESLAMYEQARATSEAAVRADPTVTRYRMRTRSSAGAFLRARRTLHSGRAPTTPGTSPDAYALEKFQGAGPMGTTLCTNIPPFGVTPPNSTNPYAVHSTIKILSPSHSVGCDPGKLKNVE